MTENITLAIIAGVVTVIGNWLTTRRRFNRSDRKNTSIEKKVDEVHFVANGRLTEALNEIRDLRLIVERQRVSLDTKQDHP